MILCKITNIVTHIIIYDRDIVGIFWKVIIWPRKAISRFTSMRKSVGTGKRAELACGKSRRRRRGKEFKIGLLWPKMFIVSR